MRSEEDERRKSTKKKTSLKNSRRLLPRDWRLELLQSDADDENEGLRRTSNQPVVRCSQKLNADLAVALLVVVAETVDLPLDVLVPRTPSSWVNRMLKGYNR